MSPDRVLLLLLIALLIVTGGYLAMRWTGQLSKEEPYRRIFQLRTRAKLQLFRMLLRDPRIPPLVKLLPIITIVYLICPIDLIPDFIPGVGHLDDLVVVVLALYLVFRLTPPQVLASLLNEIEH